MPLAEEMDPPADDFSSMSPVQDPQGGGGQEWHLTSQRSDGMENVGSFNSERGLFPNKGAAVEDDSEMAELELRAMTVEDQLEALTQQVQQLKVQKSTIQDSRQQLQEQLDAVYKNLSSRQSGGAANARLAVSKAQGLEPEAPVRRWPRMGADDYRLEKAQQAVEEMQIKLHEAHVRTEELRAEYEAQLKTLRTQSQREKAELKRGVLEQVDFLVRKYRRLAKDAVEVARKERQKSHDERGKAKEVVATACRDFEKELKEKTKQALRDFQTLAQQANDAAQRERNHLKSKCEQLERSMEKERQLLEERVVREAEKRVTGHREALQRCRADLEREREVYDKLLADVAAQVKRECQSYEKFMEKAVTRLLEKHGVNIGESEVQEHLSAAHDEFVELQHQKEIVKKNLKMADGPMRVKYGFEAFKQKT